LFQYRTVGDEVGDDAGDARPAILFTVHEANQAGVPFEATAAHPGFNLAGAITATFDYTGPLNFANTQPQNFNSSALLGQLGGCPEWPNRRIRRLWEQI